MKIVRQSSLAFVLALIASAANAELITHEQLCQRGVAEACRIVEAGSRIDQTQFDRMTGKYKWVIDLPNHFLPVPTARERAHISANAYCVHSHSVWLGVDVAAYGRLLDMVAVDRILYDECYKTEFEEVLWRERKNQLLEILKATAVAAPFVLLFAAFWYRRPLARKVRQIASQLNRLGPQ